MLPCRCWPHLALVKELIDALLIHESGALASCSTASYSALLTSMPVHKGGLPARHAAVTMQQWQRLPGHLGRHGSHA